MASREIGVRVAPMPGPLDHFETAVVHPRGFVEVAFRRNEPGSHHGHFDIRLPEGVPGTFVFAGKTESLRPGVNRISF